MNRIYSAGIITYYKEHDKVLYLLLHYAAGHWDFPKGTMESGETKKETAIRELHEETGLICSVDNNFEELNTYIYTTPLKEQITKTVYFFTGQATTQNIILSNEHTNYKWLNYTDASHQLTYNGSKILLKKAHNHIAKKP